MVRDGRLEKIKKRRTKPAFFSTIMTGIRLNRLHSPGLRIPYFQKCGLDFIFAEIVRREVLKIIRPFFAFFARVHNFGFTTADF